VVSVPNRLRQEIATTRNDPNVYPSYGGRIRTIDEVLLHKGNGKYSLYRALVQDPHIYAVLQKRYSAVIGREWEVKAASNRAADKKAADRVREQLKNLAGKLPQSGPDKTIITTAGGFDITCYGFLDAILKGFSVGEILWDTDGKENVATEIHIKNQDRFAFHVADNGYELKLLTRDRPLDGISLDARKFIVHIFNQHEGPAGLGIGSQLFWARWFKSNGIKFWLAFADKFGSPLGLGKYPQGRNDLRDALLAAMDAVAQETGIAIPENTALEFVRIAGNTDTYQALADYMDREISKAVLGETGSTDQQTSGGSRARDQVGNEVRIEIAKFDADLLSDTFNRTLCTWITELNDPEATPPTVWRKFPELEEDLDARIDRDKKIQEYGYTLKPDVFAQIYGEGYDRPVMAEDDKPALVSTLGVGGTQALLSFLQQGAPSMPRPNAIAILTTVFGISKDQAAQMVPEQEEENTADPLSNIFGSDNSGNGATAGDVTAQPEQPEQPNQADSSAAPIEANEPVEFRTVIDRVIKWNGVEIGLEYLPGQTRFPSTSHAKKLRSGYGHLRGFQGNDKEALDCYVSSALIEGRWDGSALFAVSQLSPEDGDFDEFKILMGWDSLDEAKAAYLQEMPEQYLGGIEQVDRTWLDQFRKPSSEFAESSPSQDLIDQWTDEAITQAMEVIADWKKQIAALIDDVDQGGGTDVQKFRVLVDRLPALYEQMSSDRLYNLLSNSMLAGRLAGQYEEQGGTKPNDVEFVDTSYPQLTFDNAIDWLRNKVPLPSETWKELVDEIQQYAFSVAGIENALVLQAIQDKLIEILNRQSGIDTFSDFRQSVQQVLNTAGYSSLNDYRIRTIYTTNVRQAYNAGRYAQQFDPDNPNQYLQYWHGSSIEPRPAHLALHKKVFLRSDPIWETILPSNGFGCTCKTFSLSDRDLQRQGLTVSTLSDTTEVNDPLTGEPVSVPAIRVGGELLPIAEPGFTTSPRAATPEQQDQILSKALDRLSPRLRAAAEQRMAQSNLDDFVEPES
jgi:phage gp29-like protein